MTFDYQATAGRPWDQPFQPPGEPAAAARPRMRFLPSHLIDDCKTFRDACALAWKHRAFAGQTEAYLASVCGLTQQHVSDYFRPDERDEKGRKRRQLPADKVGIVQQQLGNCAIAQWLARDMAVRLVEEFFAMEQSR